MARTIADIIADLDVQIARTDLPQANIDELTATKTDIQNAANLTVLDDMEALTTRILRNSNAIPETELNTINSWFPGFDSMMNQVIDNAFGDDLTAIQNFHSLVLQNITNTNTLVNGLNTVEANVKNFMKIINVVTGKTSTEQAIIDSANLLYSYMSTTNQTEVDEILAITDFKQRAETIKAKMKALGQGLF